jgi:hypothetical protein
MIDLANPEYSESVFEKPANVTKDNPFYTALFAQKNEREKYK